MLRIAICDDNGAFLQQTKFMLEHWDGCPAALETELFTDGDSLILAHARKPFDIVLLDVVMPLMNGIETAREMREKDKTVRLVFLTSSPEYAVESYSVRARDYILKPVVPERLFACLEGLIAEMGEISRFINVRGMDAVHRLPLSGLDYIEAQGRHSLFRMSDGSGVLSGEAFNSIENRLRDEESFFKCHRSYIVNIFNISSWSPREIVMRSGAKLPLSRGCHREFEEAYFSVLFGKAGDL